MTTTNAGAVFFLGTRAHYQVLQQPDLQDADNGNSTETIYHNSSVQELWKQSPDLETSGNYGDHWSYCGNEVSVSDEKVKIELGTGIKRRHTRRASEMLLCERDNDMNPSLLNNFEKCESSKRKSRQRASLLRFLTSMARRKRRQNCTQLYMQHLEMTSCTYKESCRCIECQSRYFDCDDSDENSSDEREFSRYTTQQEVKDDDSDDEVFTSSIPSDTTSRNLLIEGKEKMSTSSDEGIPEDLELEVVAGTPIFLNYLLTHPLSCAIQ